MTVHSLNQNLHQAKNAKKDEFYTQLPDIERELHHYQPHFKDKIVYCNCDDPRISNFFHYFSYRFETLGLKQLITTCYKNHHADLFSQHDSEHAIYLEYNGDKNGNRVPDPAEIGIKHLQGDGDFRSPEAIALLKQADIVVTNPPFSLFREFVAQLIEYDKKFVIIGNLNAITYKEIFALIKENRLWLGHMHPEKFMVPDHYEKRECRSWQDAEGKNWRSLGNACWFTNIDLQKRHEDMILYKKYTPAEYPTYENYDAINVDKTKDIPYDYAGAMGVPITFLDKHNPEQFEIVALGKVGSITFTSNKKMEILDRAGESTGKFTFNAKGTLYRLYNPRIDKYPAFRDVDTKKLYSSIYARIIIKNKQV